MTTGLLTLGLARRPIVGPPRVCRRWASCLFDAEHRGVSQPRPRDS
jgi:hypothetical protein